MIYGPVTFQQRKSPSLNHLNLNIVNFVVWKSPKWCYQAERQGAGVDQGRGILNFPILVVIQAVGIWALEASEAAVR